jgi:hypothetical protein
LNGIQTGEADALNFESCRFRGCDRHRLLNHVSICRSQY